MAIHLIDLAISTFLAVVLLALITIIATVIQQSGRKNWKKEEEENQSQSGLGILAKTNRVILIRLLLDRNGHASLAMFQFLAWTLLVSFIFLTISVIRLKSGIVSVPPETLIPATVMALMGISVVVPPASRAIEEYRRLKDRANETYTEPDYASMLEEKGKPSLLRFQMFLWTLASLAIYAGLFYVEASGSAVTAVSLKLPDIDPTLVFLMGLSQFGYLSGKVFTGEVKKETPEPVAKETGVTPVKPEVPPALPVSPPTISAVIPPRINPSGEVEVRGTGFGSPKDTLIIGEERLQPELIRRWEDTRIEFRLPDMLKPGVYPIRVGVPSGTVSDRIEVLEIPERRGRHGAQDAEIVGEIWIDDPWNRFSRLPKIGYFITGEHYHFLYEFRVPPGTPEWGVAFRTKFFVNGEEKNSHEMPPGAIDGMNEGSYVYVFDKSGPFDIEIRGQNSKYFHGEVKVGTS
jgi:hypothetical protein